MCKEIWKRWGGEEQGKHKYSVQVLIIMVCRIDGDTCCEAIVFVDLHVIIHFVATGEQGGQSSIGV